MKHFSEFLVEGEFDDDMSLKLVKTNKREVETNTYRRWGYNRGKKTEYDYELHHPSGEPVFKVSKKSYGKGYDLQWHDHMLAMHSELGDSHEHGSRRSDRYNAFQVDTKDQAKWHGTSMYKAAAKGGFRDKLETRTREGPEVEYRGQWADPTDPPSRATPTITSYHDRQTGEPIVTHHSVTSDAGKEKRVFHSSYLEAHGIDKNVPHSIKAGNAYELALGIHNEKGKAYSAVGKHQYEKATSTKVYTTGQGKSDEETSAAHEQHVTSTYGKRPNFQVVRHAPNVFHATWGEGNYTGHVTSIAHQGELTQHTKSDYASSTKLDHRF